jgi:hypothetical protein
LVRGFPGLKSETWGTHFRAGFKTADLGHAPNGIKVAANGAKRIMEIYGIHCGISARLKVVP